jgi:dTDP-4-dehydrorhamnose reductase
MKILRARCNQSAMKFRFHRQDLNIADKEKVFDAFQTEKPDAVINCAAYTNVDGSETNVSKNVMRQTRGR